MANRPEVLSTKIPEWKRQFSLRLAAMRGGQSCPRARFPSGPAVGKAAYWRDCLEGKSSPYPLVFRTQTTSIYRISPRTARNGQAEALRKRLSHNNAVVLGGISSLLSPAGVWCAQSNNASTRCACTMFSHADQSNTVNRPSCEATSATAPC